MKTLFLTSLFVILSLYHILSNILRHLKSIAVILLWSSLLIVHVSHAYTNIELTSECNRIILEFNVKFLSFQIGLSCINDAVVWAILERISFVETLSSKMEPKYLKVSTGSIISPCKEILLLKCPSQFVMICLLFVLISML